MLLGRFLCARTQRRMKKDFFAPLTTSIYNLQKQNKKYQISVTHHYYTLFPSSGLFQTKVFHKIRTWIQTNQTKMKASKK